MTTTSSPVDLPVIDPSLPFGAAAARVAAGADHHDEAARLVERLTPDERLGCLDGDLPFWPGLVDMTGGGYYTHPWPAAVVERLGIPGIHFADGPRGAVIADGVAFPVSMARGALFDPTIEERIGDAIGLELRASGASFTGAVCMNLLRHPAWGRAQETYGEDPHHAGETAAAFARGLQRHVMACMKHFALNSMENARFKVDVSADERSLHEVYLPHFRRVAAEGVASTMSAYNSVNGDWCGENEVLLTDILRREWGWDGFVISDFVFGLRDAVASVRAGLDIEMPFRQQRALALAEAIDDGRLDPADVDRCVRRVVATLLRFASLIAHTPDPTIIGCAPHRALAREVASSSMVLLRNEGPLLPVDSTRIGLLVVVGHLAATANLGDGGSSDVKSTSVVTPLDGLRAAFPDAEVVHLAAVADDADRELVAEADLVVTIVGYTKQDEGEFIDDSATIALAGELFPPMDHPTVGFTARTPDSGGSAPGSAPTEAPDDAVAPTSPVAGEVVDVGRRGEDDAGDGERYGMARGGDRSSLRLRPGDEALVDAVASLSDRAVVVVQSGSAVVTPWVEAVPAVLYGWYAGVEGGNALADVITGAAEPGGRLPFAVPTDESHLPTFDRDAVAATYDLFHGQWLLDRTDTPAHFPFGWGLGYADFEIGDIEVSVGGDTVGVRVLNVGDRDGSTVVFVHAGLPDSSVDRPLRRLVGFARVAAASGAVARPTIRLDWSQLDVRRDGGWWTEPGRYRLWVGSYAGDPTAVVVDVDRPAIG